MQYQTKDQYLEERERIKQKYISSKYSTNLGWSNEEETANQKFINDILSFHSNAPQDFQKIYTFTYLDLMRESKLFKLLKVMPKGCMQHLHTDCCFNINHLIDSFLQESIYMHKETKALSYESIPPNDENLILVSEFKKQFNNENDFKKTFAQPYKFTKEDLNYNSWQKFEEKLGQLGRAVWYKPIFEKLFYNVLQSFFDDGYQHIELKFASGLMFDENNNPIPFDECIQILKAQYNKFIADNKDFSMKLILQLIKGFPIKHNEQIVYEALPIIKENNDFIKAIDLVAEEEVNPEHINFFEILKYVDSYRKENNLDFEFVLHAGETLRCNYFANNDNIFDSVLFKAKRIGHGLNLIKHSYLLEHIKNEGITLELCPMSNQILKYYENLETHPLLGFLNYGIKVTISADDPGYMYGESTGCFDWLVSLVCQQLNLKDAKQMILNSLESSLLNKEEKQKAITNWRNKWDQFIELYLSEECFQQ